MSFEVLFLLLVELAEHPLRQHLGEADDRVQRRPQLVGHVGQELGLVLAGDFELAALLLDLQEQARVLDGQGGLGRECPQETRRLPAQTLRGLPDHSEATDQVVLANERDGEQGSVPGADERVANRFLLGAVTMSGTWIGSCTSASRPVAPSPL